MKKFSNPIKELGAKQREPMKPQIVRAFRGVQILSMIVGLLTLAYGVGNYALDPYLVGTYFDKFPPIKGIALIAVACMLLILSLTYTIAILRDQVLKVKARAKTLEDQLKFAQSLIPTVDLKASMKETKKDRPSIAGNLDDIEQIEQDSESGQKPVTDSLGT